MSHLSPLGPLSHLLVPPPVPSPIPSPLPLTLGTLDDDSLLLLFSTLALPPLLTLRGVSRRFAYLIQRYTLPQWRTLLYGYSEREGNDRFNGGREMLVDLFTSRSLHPYTDFCRGLDYWYGPRHEPFYRQPRQMHQTILYTLPASLPRLLPNLSSLTFTCHFDTAFDSIYKMKETCLAVNRLLSGYLQSSWTTTLVSLHLYLEVGVFIDQPSARFPLEPLSQLIALRHLCLQICAWHGYCLNEFPVLPDRLAVLGQLVSFALHHYPGSNAALLLAQLGPRLDSLSLNKVKCSVAQFGAFLRAKPTYGRTLRNLEIYLQGMVGEEIPVACQFLHSLERLSIDHSPRGTLRERLFNLCRLPSLRELSVLRVSLQQLRGMRDNAPREGLPRLPSIRTLDCAIVNWPNPVADSSPEEFFTTLLPLLLTTFSRLELLNLDCVLTPSITQFSDALPVEELGRRTKATFPHLRHIILA